MPQGGETTTLGRLTYTASGQAAVSVDAAGRAATYGYDALGSRTSVTQPDPDGPGPLTSPVTRFHYDALGRLTQATDPLGHTTQYAYADYGRQVTVTLPDPDGAGPLAAPVVQYQLDAAGNLLSETDPLGRMTSYSYDGLGRLVTAVLGDPDGDGPLTSQTTSYTYDKVGNLVSETDALGQTKYYTYDARNRLVSVTLSDPDGDGPLVAPVASYTYDAASQVIAQTDPTGNVTRYEYDALGRQIKVTQDPDGDGPQPEAVTTNVYDIAGRLVVVTDPLGHTTQYTYDDFDRATAITDANGGVTQMAYDATGNLVSLTDPAGNTTTWTYDALNRVTSETNELGTSRSFQYDAAGQQTRRTDRNGRVTVYAYDALGRMASESWYDSVSDADAGQCENGTGSNQDDSCLSQFSLNATNIIHYQYDAAGRLVAEWDNYSSSSYTYDALDRVTTETVANPGAPVVVFTTGYDRPDALRTSSSATIGGVADFHRTYQYDALGQMTHIGQTGQPNGNAAAAIDIDLRYDAAGRFAGLDRYLGTNLVATSTWQYDARGNLTSLTHSGSRLSTLDPPPILAAYTWSFDAAGRLIGATSPDGTVLYTYDATGQLTGADYSAGAGQGAGAGLPTEPPDETYAYDANGNRTTVAAGGSTAAYITGPNNQVLFDGSYWYAYDPEGNRIVRYVWTDLDEDNQVEAGERTQITEYAWDNRNRLVRVSTRTTDQGPLTKDTLYTYDTHNRWISRTLDPDGAGEDLAQVTHFVYDARQIIFSFADPDGSGSQPSTLSSRFLWGPAVDQILADDQFSSSVSSHVLFPLTDHLGTVRDIAEFSDATGVTAIVNHRVFDAYGQMTAQSNAAVDLLFGFTGRAFDDATGLQNNWNRWYNPDVGQWLSQDPKGFMAGDGNLHRYVSNQVSNATDPTGLDFPVFSDRGWEAYGRWAAQRGQRTASTKTVLHPLDPRSTIKPVSDDIRRVIEMCQGHPAAERAIGKLFEQTADTQRQGFYNTRNDKCFRWLKDFLKNYKYDGKPIQLEGGVVVIEPLSVPTRGGKALLTSYSALGLTTGKMTAHGLVRVTIQRPGKATFTAYFDLGSSTHLGNYGGPDHWFFDDTEGFDLEMDIAVATPFDPTHY